MNRRLWRHYYVIWYKMLILAHLQGSWPTKTGPVRTKLSRLSWPDRLFEAILWPRDPQTTMYCGPISLTCSEICIFSPGPNWSIQFGPGPPNLLRSWSGPALDPRPTGFHPAISIQLIWPHMSHLLYSSDLLTSHDLESLILVILAKIEIFKKF